MNGVCVIFRGHIDLQRLDGMACLELDTDNAKVRASPSRLSLSAKKRSSVLING